MSRDGICDSPVRAAGRHIYSYSTQLTSGVRLVRHNVLQIEKLYIDR